ncbi:MAG TPA: hypothetical protein VI454_11485, partial [Verrucomicrobiae bacterium]
WGSADGSAATAQFNNPVGLALDRAGNLFVADANNHTIREITPAGIVATFAGQPGADGFTDGTGSAARFTKPAELTIDADDSLFVADSFNHLIRKITSAGEVSTVAGLPRDDGANDGANRTARFFNPYGLAVSPRGELLVADTYNQTLRTVFVPFRVTTTLTAGGAQTLVAWPSVAGHRYQLQVKNALTDAAWQNLGGVLTANGQSLSQTDSTAASRFYRVLVVE